MPITVGHFNTFKRPEPVPKTCGNCGAPDMKRDVYLIRQGVTYRHHCTYCKTGIDPRTQN